MSIESLSALLDGELRPNELERTLAALERDPELRAQFDRLVAARAAMRGTQVRPGTAGLADRVRAALEAEAPAVTQAPVPAPPRVPRLLWVPLAAAASVAGFAVIGLSPESKAVTAPATAEAPPAPPAVTAVPVSLPAAPAAQAGKTAVVDPAAGQEQLQRYLLIHSQARADAGADGSLGYARAVTQDPPTPESAGGK